MSRRAAAQRLRARAARVPRWLAVAVPVYAASRLLTLFVAHVATVIRPELRVADVLTKWDGGWYLAVATQGYPERVPPGDAQSALAFFPAYPLAVRWLSDLTGLAPGTVAVVVAMLGGAVAAVLVWLLVARLADEAAATRATALLAFFPGAFILSWAYSEGLFLALAAGCLLALHHRRWVVAGLAAAVASATRPTGIVLAACCLWAAVAAWRGRDRRAGGWRSGGWRPFLAPLLAPLGLVAFSLYLHAHTGRLTAWLDAQGAWDQGFDFGAHTAGRLVDFAGDPLGDFNRLASAMTIAFVVFGAWAMWRWRPPVPLVVYTVGVLLPAFTSSVLTSSARFTLTAFPLVAAVGVVLEGTAFATGLAVAAATMASFMLVAGLSLGLTP